MSELALFGGPKAVTYEGTGKRDGSDLFAWPIVTKEDEEAVLEVIRNGAMSGTDITQEFEKHLLIFVEIFVDFVGDNRFVCISADIRDVYVDARENFFHNLLHLCLLLVIIKF